MPFRWYVRSLTQVLLAATLLASVDLELVKVSVVAVGEGPHLDFSLPWLQWHVLFFSRWSDLWTWSSLCQLLPLCGDRRGQRSVMKDGWSQAAPYQVGHNQEIPLEWDWHFSRSEGNMWFHETDLLWFYQLSRGGLDPCSSNHRGWQMVDAHQGYALSSSLVILLRALYFSSPITSFGLLHHVIQKIRCEYEVNWWHWDITRKTHWWAERRDGDRCESSGPGREGTWAWALCITRRGLGGAAPLLSSSSTSSRYTF